VGEGAENRLGEPEIGKLHVRAFTVNVRTAKRHG